MEIGWIVFSVIVGVPLLLWLFGFGVACPYCGSRMTSECGKEVIDERDWEENIVYVVTCYNPSCRKTHIS